MFQHRVENRQQLAHPGGEGDLRRFPDRPQSLIERLEDRIVAHRRQGAHVQHGAHVGPAPQTARLPRRVPLSRLNGATPISAAISWRFKTPNSGTSATSVRERMGPTPACSATFRL